jgi:hypothetical protein
VDQICAVKSRGDLREVTPCKGSRPRSLTERRERGLDGRGLATRLSKLVSGGLRSGRVPFLNRKFHALAWNQLRNPAIPSYPRCRHYQSPGHVHLDQLHFLFVHNPGGDGQARTQPEPGAERAKGNTGQCAFDSRAYIKAWGLLVLNLRLQ